MRHYILVRWRQREGETCRTLVNLHKIVTVVGAPKGCKIHFQGYCLDVEDSFSDVLSKIERAEAEGSRKPGRALMGTAARERQGEARHARWQTRTGGWPHCSACGWPADIDREEFRMWGNFRAAERPRCSTCGAVMDGKDTDVPAIPPDMAETQAFLEEAFGVKLHATPHSAPDVDPERKQTFRSGEEARTSPEGTPRARNEEEPGESSSIAAAAAENIPMNSEDAGGG